MKIRRTKRPAGALVGRAGYKICGMCEEELPLEDFYIRRASYDGRAYACKPCGKARHKRWYSENRASAIAKVVGARRRPAAAELRRVREARYRAQKRSAKGAT